MRGSGRELSKTRNRTAQVLGGREQKKLEETEKSCSAQSGWRSLAGFPQRASTSLPRQLRPYSFLSLLQLTQWDNWQKLCWCLTAAWIEPGLSSFQLCLCRTPPSCEWGQNQKAASSCPSQPVPAGISLHSLSQETEQSTPAVCSAARMIRRSRTKSCHAIFWAG